jgi:peptide/nickel transport system substrate-binding protein
LNRQLRLARVLQAALFVGIASGIGACERTTQSRAAQTTAGPSKGGTLTVAVRTEPRSFCSCVAPDSTAHLITLLTQARLVRVNRTTEDIEPWLAESWTRSDDGLRYVIKLIPNVLFSDGTPLTADDVVFSVAAAYDSDSAITDSLKIDGQRLQATALGPLTVAIAFPSVFSPGLRVLDAMPILSKHKMETALAGGRFGAALSVTTPVNEIVGLGPFVIADYRPGERLVFDRNDRYFRTDDRGTRLPYLDRIVLEIVPDQDAQVLKLEAGDMDTEASEIRPEDYAPLKRAADRGSLQLIDVGDAIDPDALWINLRPGAFDRDPRRSWIQRDELRQAISAAVDRQSFTDTVFLGAATPVFGPITPSNKKWYSAEVPRPAFDVTRAKQLLAEIWLVDRNHDGLVEDASGAPARFTLLTMKGQTALERGASVLSGDLKKIGLTVDVATLEGNALIQKFVSGKDYDAVYFHLTTTTTDPVLNADFWSSAGEAHIWNPGQKSPSTEWERQIDELMVKSASALDDAVRKSTFLEVQKIFAAHQPMVYFAAPRVFVAASTRLTNLTPTISRPQLFWAADTIAVRH